MGDGQQKPDGGEGGSSSSRPVWVSRQRPILAALPSERLPADSHPLLVSEQKQEKVEATSMKPTGKKSAKTKLSVSSNPLSDPLSDPLFNPLSDPLTPVEEKSKPTKAAKKETKDAFLEEWRRVRRECLAHSSSTTLPLG